MPAAATDADPAQPTFFNSPQLSWNSVDRATHYEVFVSQDGGASPYFRYTVEATNTTVQTTQILRSAASPAPIVDNMNGVVESTEVPLLDINGNPIAVTVPDGSYRFWVRAVNMGNGAPAVYGAWSGAARFSTIAGPVVTAPVPDQGYVTAARPEFTWTPIHGAARYELLIYKFNSRPPFLSVDAVSNSYTLTEDLPAGDYTVWVRAVDGRGEFSPWSAPYAITATGGRPVVTSPVADALELFPMFAWVGVPNAASYEVWVSHIGVDFTFINVDGITDTQFLPNDPNDPNATPLDNGDYRIWVRAVFADGTRGPWSVPVDFRGGIVQLESETDPAETLLASLKVETPVVAEGTRESEDVSAAEVFVAPPDTVPAEAQTEAAEELVLPPGELPQTADTQTPAATLPSDVLTKIAQECVDTEWWQAAEETI